MSFHSFLLTDMDISKQKSQQGSLLESNVFIRPASTVSVS